MMRFVFVVTLLIAVAVRARAADTIYQVKPAHPRLVIEDVRTMAERCAGPLADDYRYVKQRADAAVQRGGIEAITNPWSIPDDLMNCGLAYLIERQLGRESRPYAEVAQSLGIATGSIGFIRGRCLEKLRGGLAKLGFV